MSNETPISPIVPPSTGSEATPTPAPTETFTPANMNSSANLTETKPLAASYVGDVAPKDLPKLAGETVIPDEVGSAEWTKSLPEDLRGEKMFANFKSVEDLARSFASAQRMMGKEKIPVPDPKTASDEDYRNVYKKLGLPEDAKDFKMDISPDAGLDPDFLKKIAPEAHKLGILPKQLEKLLGWYGGEAKAIMEARSKEHADAHQQSHVELKNEWGKAYDKNLLAAQLALKDAATPEDVKYMEEKNMLTDTRLIKIFSKFGNMLKEGELKGGNNGGANILAPAQAQAEAHRIMGDANHPYNKAEHANHAMAVKEVGRLMEMAHPEENKS